MNYRESLTYLDGLNVFGVRLGLARIQRLLDGRRRIATAELVGPQFRRVNDVEDVIV